MTRTEPAPLATERRGPDPTPGREPAAGDDAGPRWSVWLGAGIVALCCAYVLWQQHPDLLLRDTTATGGDTGAHVWGPAFLRDHLLPQWRLTGWAPDFYGGFPAYQFYWPVPALLVVLVDVAVPYNVAFKLVTALGPTLLPASAYLFLRGLRAPRPAPELGAVAAVAFLFFEVNPGTTPEAQSIAFNQRIMGGTLTSNLAGEFSYTIALCLGLCFLGALAVALRRGGGLALPAALLALTVTSHLVVGLFAVLGAVVVWACTPGVVRRLPALAAVGVVGGLLTAVWSLPLLATLPYTTNMRYTKITEFREYLLPGYLGGIVYALVAVALAAGALRRRRSTLVLALLTAAVGLWFVVWPELHAWNLRFLPFWYLGLLLLAAVGAAEALRAAAVGVRLLVDPQAGRPAAGPPPAAAVPDDGPARVVRRAGTTGVATVLAVVLALAWLVRINGTASLDAWLPAPLEGNSTGTRGYAPYWAEWNYTGYEGKASYPEYRDVVATMAGLPPGRAAFEKVTGDNGGDVLNWYGSDFALYLLPYWTDGRIASMEGLHFEASATTPYHFLTMSKLARNPANSVRGLEYGTLEDFDLGVRQLRVLGVRYYMVQSVEARTRADASPGLRLVAQVPDADGLPPSGWWIYEVAGGEALVEPLAYEPVVLDGVDAGDGWLDASTAWFDDPLALRRPLTAGGPSSWVRAGPGEAQAAPLDELAPVEVTDVAADDRSISFRVSRPGVPVLVKASYFPNWRVDGARGPWRATPNSMVVVPTATEVRLEYARTGAEWLGLAGSVLGLAGLVALALFWRPAAGRRGDGTPPDPAGGRGDGTPPDPAGGRGDGAPPVAAGPGPGPAAGGAGPGPGLA